MRIHFLIADYSACGFYRVMQPAKYLAAAGHSVSVSDRMTRDITEADVVVCQRLMDQNSFNFVSMAKTANPNLKVVYELDDFLHGVPDSNPASKSFQNPLTNALNTVENFIKISDCMSVSTQFLGEIYSSVNGGKFKVTPNVVDLPFFGPREQYFSDAEKKDSNQISIGWAGSPTHFEDLQIVMPAMHKLVEKYDNVKFCFFGYCPPGLVFNFPFKNLKNCGAAVDIFTYPLALTSLNWDIGIAPLYDNNFNKSKSNIKWLEYTAAGMATVASKGTAYDCIKDDEGILVDNTTESWYQALEFLVNNRKAGYAMRSKSLEKISQEYNYASGLAHWENLLGSLVDKKLVATGA